jgi:hypothetical protein
LLDNAGVVRRLGYVGLAAVLLAGCGGAERPAQVIRRTSHSHVAHELNVVPGVRDPNVLLRLRGIGTFRALCDRHQRPATEFVADGATPTLRVAVSDASGSVRGLDLDPPKRVVAPRRRPRTLLQHWQLSTHSKPDIVVAGATISSTSGKPAGFPGCQFAGQASIDRRPRPDDDAPPTG